MNAPGESKKIEIREIGTERRADINLPNEPFALFGRMEPSYLDGQWSYREVLEEDVSEIGYLVTT